MITLEIALPHVLNSLHDEIIAAGVRPTLVSGDGEALTLRVADEAEAAIVESVVAAHDAGAAQQEVDLRALREKRDSVLAESDWTQLADAPLDAATLDKWIAYRQELRDLPATVTDPADPVWPRPPKD